MHELFEQLDRLPVNDRTGILGTLTGTSGPSPRRVGAKMWIGESGRTLGSVSVGGCIDARVADVAADVMREGKPRLLTIDMSDATLDLGFTCTGLLNVLIEPVSWADRENEIVRSYERLRAGLERGGRSALLTRLDGNFERALFYDDALHGTLGAAELDAAARQIVSEMLDSGNARTVQIAGTSVFVEVHQPAPLLAVLGAGPVAPPLIELAHTLGFRTLVVDARAKLANSAQLPGADEVQWGDPGAAARALSGPNTAAVLLAHDYKYDLPVLRALLAGDVAYLGLLGSRRRGRALLQFLEDEGFSPDALRRIRVPVGLDLGADSPKELALSILAEVMAVLRGRSGTPLSTR
ncbi:MAG TPA: XdhC family protein [Longimicrobiales bacterium]|nr:XdhC family protein [Longimicrobiales bacterium]